MYLKFNMFKSECRVSPLHPLLFSVNRLPFTQVLRPKFVAIKIEVKGFFSPLLRTRKIKGTVNRLEKKHNLA